MVLGPGMQIGIHRVSDHRLLGVPEPPIVARLEAGIEASLPLDAFDPLWFRECG